MRQPAVYILANKRNGTLYTGVTSNLVHGIIKGFTHDYDCKTLVYYELFDKIIDAIAREKQIKAGTRLKKLILIESINPNCLDLYETFKF
jgi:putative endonuclease